MFGFFLSGVKRQMDKRGEGEINLQEFKEALMEGWALLEELPSVASASTPQLVRRGSRVVLFVFFFYVASRKAWLLWTYRSVSKTGIISSTDSITQSILYLVPGTSMHYVVSTSGILCLVLILTVPYIFLCTKGDMPPYAPPLLFPRGDHTG